MDVKEIQLSVNPPPPFQTGQVWGLADSFEVGLHRRPCGLSLLRKPGQCLQAFEKSQELFMRLRREFLSDWIHLFAYGNRRFR